MDNWVILGKKEVGEKGLSVSVNCFFPQINGINGDVRYDYYGWY